MPIMQVPHFPHQEGHASEPLATHAVLTVLGCDRGGPAAHLACSSFKYFWKSLSECEVAVFQCYPEGGLQALDCNCKEHTDIFFCTDLSL